MKLGCVALTSAAILTAPADARAERGDGPKGIAPSGYVQVDLVPWRESSRDEVDPSTGVPRALQGFSLPRARARLDAWYDEFEAAIELDAATIPSPAIRPVVALVGARVGDDDVGAQLAIGLQKTPFGADALEENLARLQLERAVVTDALFPGIYDLGASVVGHYRGASVTLAAVNGAPILERGFAGRDPTESLDFIGRIALDHPLRKELRLLGGVSMLYGKGLHPGTRDTKDELVWRDANDNGIVELTEIQVIQGSAATASATFERFAVGADVALEVPMPWAGRLRLFAEGVLAKNLDRGLYIADPVARSRSLRELGYAIGIRQEVTEYAEAGARFDHYDPDFDASEIQGFEVVPVDPSFDTLAVTVAARWKVARFIIEYNHRENALGRGDDGRPTTREDDSFALRAELRFP